MTVLPAACVVLEQVAAGVTAARIGGMVTFGSGRLGAMAMQLASWADRMETRRDQVETAVIADGVLHTCREIERPT